LIKSILEFAKRNFRFSLEGLIKQKPTQLYVWVLICERNEREISFIAARTVP